MDDTRSVGSTIGTSARHRWSAIVVGFVGALIVAFIGGVTQPMGPALLVGAATAYGFLLRRLARSGRLLIPGESDRCDPCSLLAHGSNRHFLADAAARAQATANMGTELHSCLAIRPAGAQLRPLPG